MKLLVFFRYADEDFFSRIGVVDADHDASLRERAIRQHIRRFDSDARRLLLDIVERDGVLEVVAVRRRTAEED